MRLPITIAWTKKQFAGEVERTPAAVDKMIEALRELESTTVGMKAAA